MAKAKAQSSKDNLHALEAARRTIKRQAARERKARIATYRGHLKVRLALAPVVTPPSVMADGDSWFDYPEILLTGGGVINHLEDISGVEILNTAHYGDSVQELLGVEKRQRIEALLKDPGFDILLFSGGEMISLVINFASGSIQTPVVVRPPPWMPGVWRKSWMWWKTVIAT